VTDGQLTFSLDGRFFRRGNDRVRIHGIAYGPFEKPLTATDVIRRDLDHIGDLGFNALRVYERPSISFLDACAERGIVVFVSLKWESNTDFLRAETEILNRLSEDTLALRKSSAVAGYFLGNEVPATLVRWMGCARVRTFLERAYETLHQSDPSRLYAYANYPSTEYLQPRNGDFAAFNIYLEERDAVRRYVRRLHHLADDRPLVISEYGLDSVRNGEPLQAETVAWLTEEIFDSGAAGAFLFSYTDDWFNGGRQMTDWGFGLVSADRTTKPSAASVAESLRKVGLDRSMDCPLISVIVCTHNGHRYLPACLDSLAKSRYPNQEVLVIDDGSRPGIDVMVANHLGMRYVRQEHGGLSVARNRGAAEASGKILAFTDDDCEPDPDWLHYLNREFQEQRVDVCGGPNIAMEAESLMERCIQLAPGNPTHVMLDDFRAEHLPGCNLAVTREAFDAVGGFREHYRVAGDDVDFCWRLQFESCRLGFAPNAVVWHHRRKTWSAFMRQQLGYGRAEALLQWDHPQKYGRWGGMDWKGTVYTPLGTRALSRPVIYYGQDGLAPFQSIYNGRQEGDHGLNGLCISFPWLVGMVVMCLIGFGVSLGWWIVAGMLLCSFSAAVWQTWALRMPETAEPWRARILLAWLHWSPVLCRQGIRWLHAGPRHWHRALWQKRLAFWSSEGVGRETILTGMRTELGEGGHSLGETRPNQWAPFDLALPSSALAHLTLLTATEHHDRQDCLTRLAVKVYPKRWLQAVFLMICAWMLGQVFAGHWWWGGASVTLLSLMVFGMHWHARHSLSVWIEILKEQGTKAGLKWMD
jgi:GT2 family glycosyltransferase